jgi:SprT protein
VDVTKGIGAAKLAWALEEAVGLMNRHGLSNWQFNFNRRKRKCGLCRFPFDGKPGVIELSVFFVDLNDEAAIRDTILHEIAHALAGKKGEYGHGRLWKEMATRVGAKPLVCNSSKKMPGNWQGTCGGCGRTHTRHRKPKQLEHFCIACGPERGRFTYSPVAV